MLAGAYWSIGGSKQGASVYKCEMLQTDYRVVKLPLGDKKLATTLYVSPLDDEVTASVLDFARDQAAPSLLAAAPRHRGHASLHSFYTTLCADSAPGRCQGLALDVGAYIGTHALYLARLGFEVHAFEPFKPSADLLRCSVAANRFAKLHVLALAVSDHNGTDCLLEPPANRRQLALVAPKGADCTFSPELKVDTTTLDNYWTSHLQQRQILLLKVDAEGHEDAVLAGAVGLLHASPPRFILLEYYPEMLTLKGVALPDFFNRIFRAGYRVYDCQQSREVPRTAEGMEGLAVYKEKNLVTDLLLAREAEFPEGSALPKWSCGYDA